MKTFARIMTVIGIIILFSTCAVFLLSYYGVIEIGNNISSMVFCALGLAFLCYSPKRYVSYTEKEASEKKPDPAGRRAFIMYVSAGIIMLVLSVVKFLNS